MKKIKDIKQLRKEKKLFLQREKELLRQINSGWRQLKEDLQPQNILKEQVRCKEETSGTRKEEGILKSTLSFGASLLVKKLAKRAEEKLEKIFS
jgi:hypothetical protein